MSEGKSRALTAVALIVVVVSGCLVYTGSVKVPERFNPWAPLDPLAHPNVLTGYKLSRSRSVPALCLAALDRTGMAFERLADSFNGTACGFTNAVRLRNAGVRIGAPVPLNCPMALSYFMWETHILQAAAENQFGQRGAALQHLGSYACRNINAGEGSRPTAAANAIRARSRHATADALDIAGFTLQDGKRIMVARDWGGTDAQALFLRETHHGACRYFTGVLGPDYNGA